MSGGGDDKYEHTVCLMYLLIQHLVIFEYSRAFIALRNLICLIKSI